MALLLLFVFWFVPPIIQALGVWPQPDIITTAEYGVYWFTPSLNIQFNCGNNVSTHIVVSKGSFGNSFLDLSQSFWSLTQRLIGGSESSESAASPLTEQTIIHGAVQRSVESISTTKFVPWKFHHRHSVFEPAFTNQQHISSLVIKQSQCPSTGTFQPVVFFGGDESYQVDFSNGTATLSSNSTLGSLWALYTFEQFFYAHSSGMGSYTPYAHVSLSDKPKWSHRGLSLDIARNVYLPKDLTRVIDAVSSVKLNRLHLHATDSQSWPLDIPALPDLAKKGAYQPSFVWSSADLAMVQQYGAERGVQVYIEVDMPGHTAAIAEAYPELIAAFNELDWSTFAAEPESGQLKLNSSKVYDFLDTLFADLLPRLSSFSHLYHGGGDEVNQMVYLLDETVRSNSTDVIKPLLQKFESFIFEKAVEKNFTPIFWEEMILDWDIDFPNRSTYGNAAPLIQVWQHSSNIRQVLEKGHRVLFGDYGYWYLDCGFGGFINPYPSGKSPPGVPYNTSGGQPSQEKPPFLDYCTPYKNWRDIYMYDPLENIPSDLQHLIEGGEVLLWSEQTDPMDVDAKLWPRAAAAAEVLWSGPRTLGMVENASNRLGQWRERIVTDHGVRAGPVQMAWCLMEGGCNF